MYSYPGNIHIHSLHSDGSGTFEQIAAAAASAGVSFVIITDHETLHGLPEEGIRRGVVVLVGVELNRKFNHYLALGLTGTVPSDDEQPQEVIDRVQAGGALGFIAHPFEKGSPLIDGGRAYPWTRWPVNGFTGLEIWNYTSHWRGRASTVPEAIYWFLLNRKAAMDGPPPEALKLWDCYTGHGRRVVAIGGTDAHAARRRIGFIPVAIFPYRFLFRTINTYICLEEPLSGDFNLAKKQIYGALAEGSCFVSFDQLHSGQGFSFQAAGSMNQKRLSVPMGGAADYREGIELAAKSPFNRAVIRLLKNGRLIRRVDGPVLSCKAASPGAYRVEVYYRPLLGPPRPWIYSNPIYLRRGLSPLTCTT
jgi:hypothetical protein